MTCLAIVLVLQIVCRVLHCSTEYLQSGLRLDAVCMILHGNAVLTTIHSQTAFFDKLDM